MHRAFTIRYDRLARGADGFYGLFVFVTDILRTCSALRSGRTCCVLDWKKHILGVPQRDKQTHTNANDSLELVDEVLVVVLVVVVALVVVP